MCTPIEMMKRTHELYGLELDPPMRAQKLTFWEDTAPLKTYHIYYRFPFWHLSGSLSMIHFAMRDILILSPPLAQFPRFWTLCDLHTCKLIVATPKPMLIHFSSNFSSSTEHCGHTSVLCLQIMSIFSLRESHLFLSRFFIILPSWPWSYVVMSPSYLPLDLVFQYSTCIGHMR